MEAATDKERSFANARSSLAFSHPPRHRYVKSISLGLNDALFSVSRYPWVLFELIAIFGLFQAGVWISPFGVVGNWSAPFVLAGSVFTASFTCVALGMGSYDRAHRFDFATIIRTALAASFVSALAALALVYFVFYNVIGRWTIVYGVASSVVGVLSVRVMLAWLLRKNPYRFTIIGRSPSMDEVIEYCAKGRRLSHIYVYIPWDSLFSRDETPSMERLLAAKIGDIVLTTEAAARPESLEFALSSLQAKLRVVSETAFYVQLFERLPIDEISKEWVLREGIAKRQIVTIACKRLLDIVLSALALVVLAPLMLVIAALIKLTSRGPALFNQTRQGRYSQPFKMYKFRTMRAADSSETAAGGFTRVGDSRVTWIGKILRPLHLDELPQLLNILLGDMSLVGPRPEALEFAKKMRRELPLYELRYLVRPGLTGHAQINQGYAMDNVLDTKTKLSYDLYYLCYHSIWLDFQLMLRTVFFLTKRSR